MGPGTEAVKQGSEAKMDPCDGVRAGEGGESWGTPSGVHILPLSLSAIGPPFPGSVLPLGGGMSDEGLVLQRRAPQTGETPKKE